jgi:hypothetical protein
MNMIRLLALPMFALGFIIPVNRNIPLPATSSLHICGQTNTAGTGFYKIKQRAGVLKKFIQANGYNESFCFIVNMSIASGKNRFFIYNLKKDSIENSGLVTHGSGSVQPGDELVFKNTINSLATSLGKYKIGNAYNGQFGLAFKLYGLDPTNDKAFERAIVLHSMNCVPESPVFPASICQSWGCPAVAPDFLKLLKSKIIKSPKPVLLDLQYLK